MCFTSPEWPSQTSTWPTFAHFQDATQMWHPPDTHPLLNLGYSSTLPGSLCSAPSVLITQHCSGSDRKESACNVRDLGSIPGLGRSPGGGHGNPLQYSCPGESHGQRSLVGYSPWGRKELDMTERLSTVHCDLIYLLPSEQAYWKQKLYPNLFVPSIPHQSQTHRERVKFLLTHTFILSILNQAWYLVLKATAQRQMRSLSSRNLYLNERDR